MKQSKLHKLLKEIIKELQSMEHEELICELVKLGKHPLTRCCLELHENIKEYYNDSNG